MPLAGEIMTDDCRCVGEHESVADAARQLASLDIGAMPICGDDNRLKGMITDRDITVKVVAEGRDPARTEVGELAQGTPVWVDAGADLEFAVRLMTEHDVRRLPVIEDHRLVGIISQADVARHASAERTGGLVEAISTAAANN
jgi:CBS domain-containing protein